MFDLPIVDIKVIICETAKLIDFLLFCHRISICS